MTLELLAQMKSQPWAMHEDHLAATLHALQAYGLRGIRAAAKPEASRQTPQSIRLLRLMGPIVQRAGLLSQLLGWSALQSFNAGLNDAAADETVGQILIELDSPGGSVYGVTETAKAIFQARQRKPVVAVANSLAASAAYWLGSQADEFFVTPGGEVGSIGVFATHEDVSDALSKAGINVTLISAGKYKTEGNAYGPLDRDARAHMQSRVSDYYGMFTRDVARGRAVTVDQVRRDMGQGRLLGADAALAAGMIDGVQTFDQVVQRMVRSARVQPGARNARAVPDARPALAHARRVLQLAGSEPQPEPARAPNRERAERILKGLE